MVSSRRDDDPLAERPGPTAAATDLAPATEAGEGSRIPKVRLEGIVKRFPGVVANDDISLAFYAGEVHCLLGENGAGKSTLMNILSGVYRPDAGRILIDEREVTLSSPRRAIELGVGMVHQHLVLAPALTVLENLMLGEYPGIRLSRSKALARLQELAAMLGVDLEPSALVGDLALGQRQQVEIIKALWRDSAVLILDEPTSMLTPKGVEELEKVLERLRERGYVIVFITHKLHEAIRLGDRVSFLRTGKVVGGLEPTVLRTTDHDQLQEMIVTAMFGEEAGSFRTVAELQDLDDAARDSLAGSGPRTRTGALGAPLLELIEASAEGEAHEIGASDVSLALYPGEIVGVAGVDGNGQRVLAEMISGHLPLTRGHISLEGRPLDDMSAVERERAGVRYVTDDSIGEGTVGQLSISLNMLLKRIGWAPYWVRGRTQPRPIDEKARELVREFDVRTWSEKARAGTLSGGNLRKVVLARELSFDPRVIVYNKPTYGLDIRTTMMVRDRIKAQAASDVASLVISTDLDELLAISHRIAVLYQGRITGVIDNDGSRDARRVVGQLMIGVDPGH